MVPQVDLHRQEVSLTRLRVLDDPEADVLVTECFVLPSRLPKLVELRVAALPYRPSSTVDLDREAVVSILGHGDISPVAVVTAIAVGSRLRAFVVGSCVVIIVKVEEEIVLVLRAVTGVAIIIELETVVCIVPFNKIRFLAYEV